MTSRCVCCCNVVFLSPCRFWYSKRRWRTACQLLSHVYVKRLDNQSTLTWQWINCTVLLSIVVSFICLVLAVGIASTVVVVVVVIPRSFLWILRWKLIFYLPISLCLMIRDTFIWKVRLSCWKGIIAEEYFYFLCSKRSDYTSKTFVCS